MPNQDFRCLVLTLDHAQARRDTISARLRSLGIPFEFVAGVDGQYLDVPAHPRYIRWKRRIFFGRDLSSGELGCILAHRNACQHIVNTGYEITLVLEDDALLSDDLPDVMDALLTSNQPFDLVRFLGRTKNYRSSRILTPLGTTGVMLARPTGISGGAYGYVLTLHAARRLLALTEKNWLPIDTLHSAVWLSGLKTLSVIPSPIMPNDGVPSCIDELDAHLRWNKAVTLTGIRKLAYPFTRGLFKCYLAIMTRWTKLKTCIPDRRLR